MDEHRLVRCRYITVIVGAILVSVIGLLLLHNAVEQKHRHLDEQSGKLLVDMCLAELKVCRGLE